MYETIYTRSSRSVEAARKRTPNRTFLDKLKFSELDYACVHGGRDYKSKATMSKVRHCGTCVAFIHTNNGYGNVAKSQLSTNMLEPF